MDAEGAFNFELRVSTSQIERVMDPRQLGGTNIALWNEKAHFSSPLLKQWVSDLKPGIIRIPGGSWEQLLLLEWQRRS